VRRCAVAERESFLDRRSAVVTGGDDMRVTVDERAHYHPP
jgi:hypothetical protein